MPYLGFYLTDLAFIEDGTPNSSENGLINFSKMRMVRMSCALCYSSEGLAGGLNRFRVFSCLFLRCMSSINP